MANYTIGDNIYAAGPFPVAYVGTALATLKPTPVVDFVSLYAAATYSVGYFATGAASLEPIAITDSMYPALSGYAVSSLSTELAELKPTTITDTVWSALSYSVNFLPTTGATLVPSSAQGLFQAYVSGYSPQSISTVSAGLKPRNISGTAVFDIFTKPTPSFGQIWPPGLPE